MRFSDFKELAQVTGGTILILAALLSLCFIVIALWRILT
jgi:hypothetical protein